MNKWISLLAAALLASMVVVGCKPAEEGTTPPENSPAASDKKDEGTTPKTDEGTTPKTDEGSTPKADEGTTPKADEGKKTPPSNPEPAPGPATTK